jgi:N6-L-threonylcarbamoyladenine synthase
MLNSSDLDFSFSGLKTAVLTLVRKEGLSEASRADIALAFQDAAVEVLVAKSIKALKVARCDRLVVAGGVGANRALRKQLDDAARRGGFAVHYPPLELCTDNGAMIALAGALRMPTEGRRDYRFSVRPRWSLSELRPVA